MKVRTTLRPHEEIEVDEAEYTDLLRHGLLIVTPDPPKQAAKNEKKD
ncbi:hypothetical protein [Streptomyces anulatus]|nr:hypothetical protein [Streptomyces anulatus]MCX4504562.1 hypothetical protein [Streptomyces anulatus]